MIGKFRTVVTSANGVEIGEHGTELVPVGVYDNDYTEREAMWHWHREMELIHMLKGSLRVSLPGEQMIINAGDALFINSGVMHAAANAESKSCLFHSIVFLPEFISNGEEGVFWKKYILPLMENGELRSMKIQGDLEFYLNELWKTCEEEPFAYEFILREQLSKIICTVIGKSQNIRRVGGKKMSRANYRVKRMLEYIHENYMMNISTRELADCVNVSESECLRCFKEVLGITPIQYVKKYRLQMAADMISATHLTITEVAGRCGFEHMSYFASSFEKMFGTTPREYRKRVEKHTVM